VPKIMAGAFWPIPVSHFWNRLTCERLFRYRLGMSSIRISTQKDAQLSSAAQKIGRFYRRQKRMPSFSEVATLFGYASKMAAHRLIEKLIKAGYLSKDKKGRLIGNSRMGLPVLGYIQAGFPSPAEEELVDTLSLDEYLVRNPDQSFMLKVTGDSMIDAGIHSGDIVIVEKGRQAKTGDIVLAQVDRDWTLKYFRREKKGVVLVAANPKYPKIYPKEELIIGGVVKAVIRRY